jgi:oxygen-independent coproporphyrinogen-3 oxidase
MAGIYFHIPFCKSKCNYCDFFSTVNLKWVNSIVEAELKELSFRKEYINNELVNTVYFGGGTPTLLTIQQLCSILNFVRFNFMLSEDCEITIECNPEDLDKEYLLALRNIGFNRLSIGIQSFNNSILSFLGRRHDNSKLFKVVYDAKYCGFNNVSVDLIFGIPGVTRDDYMYSLDSVLDLGIQHISAYSLTIEKGTFFYKQLRDKVICEINDEEMIQQFNLTIDRLEAKGYIQYEISSYALDGFISKHNSSYWRNENYLGIGPSAHSYNGVSRQWNVSSINKYLSLLGLDDVFEIEFLSVTDKYNEYMLTGLRTFSGVSVEFVNSSFNQKIAMHFNDTVNIFSKDKLLYQYQDRVKLTRKGIFISDFIIRTLFYSY